MASNSFDLFWLESSWTVLQLRLEELQFGCLSKYAEGFRCHGLHGPFSTQTS
ncbi:DEKNAAC104763 [Brettanomyces naardenensis]|uniref:DEKNAAC104763 n=1 Tax=Brettanomyces naardenensis TaxID=13370 RepID=A0A448YRD9_BRENA|nr:DEKNAAC104763 [Brettanomyces naardenensis]